ncbi:MULTISPECIES: hypothetical protein [unclassified Microcoleus]|uniref:hypothetical protein n=1 Tax=unclassified Microcoleus TaxID=2642155 RepID=UPI002FD14109
MPVPQEINFIVEQASCLFLTMVQDASFIRLTTAILDNNLNIYLWIDVYLTR